jgi:hypothetical protein
VPFSIASTPRGQVLKLAGAVTIRNAQELAAKLGECRQDGAPVVVDTRELEDIDTCIVQLLYSLRQTVPALSFDSPSRAFLAEVDRRGLRRELLGPREGS